MGTTELRLLTPKGVENMKRFKYRGVDLSLLYRYFSGPLAETCVHCLPRWLAPNLVTLIGFVFPIFAYILTHFYAPDLRDEVPSWVFAYAAAALFVYSLFDNMDGKQARRTGSASPLGLLFDHGCDSLNGTLSSLMFVAAMRTGNLANGALMVYGIWWPVVVAFFYATWEEYHTGEFILPVINGPNEGLLLTELCLLITARYGSAVWAGYEWVLPALGCTSAAFTVIGQTASVHSTMVKRGKSPWPAYRRLLPCFIVLTMPLVWILASPAFAADSVRWILLLYGFTFCEVVARLMLAHVVEEEYVAPWPSIAVATAAGAHAIAGAPMGEGAVLGVALVACTASYARFAYLVIDEFCTVLGISWYRVPKQAKD